MPEPSITIRRAESPADYVALQHAQRRAWGLVDDSYVVPVATMVGAQHHGGLVLGAFTPEGEAVGALVRLPRPHGRSRCLYSQLTGVIPGHQGQGMGADEGDPARPRPLDRRRDHRLGFDPLQAGNAHFNLRRLGATARRYVENMYGPRTDDLNRGVPTDRLIAEWPVDPIESPVEDDFQALGSPRLVEGPEEPIAAPFVSFEGITPLLVEIPAEIARLRLDDPPLAERWRAAVAGALTEAFAAGYVAEDVVREAGRSSYVLRRA